MNDEESKRTNSRMIHIRLTSELHKKLRIRAAETDLTIQDWVEATLKRELERQLREKEKNATSKGRDLK